jgi:hypothetical protein
MSRVTSLPDKTDFAIATLRNNYLFIRNQFEMFFPDLIDYVIVEYGIIPSGWNDGSIHSGTIELKEDEE